MGIYRGPGGTGDAVNDASSEAVLTVQAKNAALAAQTAAETASTNASASATSAAASATAAAASAATIDTTAFARKANNLSDLTSASTARTNLGVTATGSDTVYAYRANNLSDLASVSTARTNLGLGTAATTNSTAYATAAQGTKADSALQPAAIGSSVQAYDSDLATIAGLTPTNNYAIIGNGTSWTSSALPSGGVTSVTGTAPVVSSGGTTPAISMAAATASVNGYMTSTYAAKLDGIAAGATANTGTVTSIVAGTGLSGGTITTSGTVALANTAVTAGSYTNANITVDAQGRLTAASNGSSASGTVTSVATGNGLSGGTITTSGTLVLACPSFNSVGSYAWGSSGAGGISRTWTSGSNYAAGSSGGQFNSVSFYDENTGSGLQLTGTNNLSGTWKLMGGTVSTGNGSAYIVNLICRVS